MNSGKIFEEDFKTSIPKNIYWFRIRDPAQSFNPNVQTGLRFSLPNPYDLILFDGDTLFLLELKSTKGTSFSFTGKSQLIKEHQIKELTKAIEYKSIIAGFVFNFRKLHENKTYFLHIGDFNNFVDSTDKKSINEKDILNNNAIEIISKIKKVRYKYNISDFVRSFYK
jgi:penicillin-binding protein-related factor A (putative recombinase)